MDAGENGFEYRVLIAEACQKQHTGGRAIGEHVACDIHPTAVREADVEEEDIGLELDHQLSAVLEPTALADDRHPRRVVQDTSNSDPQEFMVIDEHDPNWC